MLVLRGQPGGPEPDVEELPTQGTKFNLERPLGNDHRRGVYGANHGQNTQNLSVEQRRGMRSMERLEGRWNLWRIWMAVRMYRVGKGGQYFNRDLR